MPNFIALAHLVQALSCFQRRTNGHGSFDQKELSCTMIWIYLVIGQLSLAWQLILEGRVTGIILKKDQYSKYKTCTVKNCEIDLPRIARYLLDSKLSWNLKKICIPRSSSVSRNQLGISSNCSEILYNFCMKFLAYKFLFRSPKFALLKFVWFQPIITYI